MWGPKRRNEHSVPGNQIRWTIPQAKGKTTEVCEAFREAGGGGRRLEGLLQGCHQRAG
jgi:hypothetical protein